MGGVVWIGLLGPGVLEFAFQAFNASEINFFSSSSYTSISPHVFLLALAPVALWTRRKEPSVLSNLFGQCPFFDQVVNKVSSGETNPIFTGFGQSFIP